MPVITENIIESRQMEYSICYEQNDSAQHKPTLQMWLVFGGKIHTAWPVQSHLV